MKLFKSLFAFIILFQTLSINAQIKITGKVIDEASQEALSGASIYLTEHRNIGTIANHKGLFVLSLPDSLNLTKNSVTISMVGYQSKKKNLAQLKKQKNYWLCPLQGLVLETVYVKPKKRKYKKKGNPAVAIIEKAILYKDKNRIESFHNIVYQVYKRQTIGITDSVKKTKNKLFTIEPEKWELWSDTSAFEKLYVHPFSFHEKLSVRSKIKGKEQKELVIGRRYEGLEEALEGVQFSDKLERMIPELNLYQNNIFLLYNHFPSPMSRNFSTSFYKYFLLDTVPINGRPNYQIAVIPFNPQSMGVKGTIWVDTLDYAISKIDLEIPKKTNVNWVKDCYFTAQFSPLEVDGKRVWLPKRQELHLLLTPTEWLKHCSEFNQVFIYHKFKFNEKALDSLALDPRKIFTKEVQENINRPKKSNFGIMERPEALSPLTQGTIDMMKHIHNKPLYFLTAKSIQIFARGFIGLPWNELKRENYYGEIGPIESIFSWNAIEGFRLRFGGMSSARLNRHLFAKSYIAYGFRDKEWKYYGNIIYSFIPKEQHEMEFPIRNLSISYYKDLFLNFSQEDPFYKDSAFKLLGSMNSTKRFYKKGGKISFINDFNNEWNTKIWAELKQLKAVGSLAFYKINNELKAVKTQSISDLSLGFSISYTPNRKPIDNRRPAKDVNKDRFHPTILLSARYIPKGILGNKHHKGFISTRFNNRFYLSLFGYVDTDIKAGFTLGKMNETDLFTPEINTSLIFSPEKSNLLQSLEVIADKYIECSIDYHLRGLILNRIPWINKLGLKEVISLYSYWGDVSNTNKKREEGVFIFPKEVALASNYFYCEGSIGLENIFRLLSIRYCYRFTPPIQISAPKWKIKIGINMNF